MEYTEKFNFRLPQTTDDVSIADINFNTQEIEEALITAVMDSEAIQAVWGSDSPEETTVSGAFAKLALSIPLEMGEVDQVPTVTEDGVVWETPPRILMGTYTGTGVTTLSLALPFKPIILHLVQTPGGTTTYNPHNVVYNGETLHSDTSNTRLESTVVSYEDGILTMGGLSSVAYFCNQNNIGYTYIAIG